MDLVNGDALPTAIIGNKDNGESHRASIIKCIELSKRMSLSIQSLSAMSTTNGTVL